MPTAAPEPAPRWQGPHLGRILGAEAVLGAKAVRKAEVIHIHSFWHPGIGLAAASSWQGHWGRGHLEEQRPSAGQRPFMGQRLSTGQKPFLGLRPFCVHTSLPTLTSFSTPSRISML